MKRVTIEKTVAYKINGTSYTKEQIKKHIVKVEATKYLKKSKLIPLQLS